MRGVTLIEMLVVLVLIGIATAMVSASVFRGNERVQEMRWVHKLEHELTKARGRAIFSGRTQRLLVLTEQGRLVAKSGGGQAALLDLPPGYHFSLDGIPLNERGGSGARYGQKYGLETEVDDDDHIFSFYPDGTATDAEFYLETPTLGIFRYRVSAITAKIDTASLSEVEAEEAEQAQLETY